MGWPGQGSREYGSGIRTMKSLRILGCVVAVLYMGCTDGSGGALESCDDTRLCGSDSVCVNRVCLPRCTENSCSEGQVCGHDGLCTLACGDTHPCADNAICVEGLCEPRCSDANPCVEGRVCGAEGRCVEPCTSSGCPDGQICSESGVCFDRCTSKNDCASGEVCEVNTGKCIAECTIDSCADGQVCGDDGLCVVGECSQRVACPNGLICTDDHVCVRESECYFARHCEEGSYGYEKCLAGNKWCPEGKQCNALNKCIDSSTADGLGLGEPCDETHLCASDLACIKGYCKEGSYKIDRNSCTSGSFQNRCVGNIIIECDEDTGTVAVQDCKTSYTDFTVPTTGIFYGEDFYCMKQPGENYVVCAQKCEAKNAGATKHICGWDLTYTDVDYSDLYVCKSNEDGAFGYFHEDTEECASTCEYTNVLCDG